MQIINNFRSSSFRIDSFGKVWKKTYQFSMSKKLKNQTFALFETNSGSVEKTYFDI